MAPDIIVRIKVENWFDQEMVRRGTLPAGAVSVLAIDAIVDEQTMLPILPRDVVEALALAPLGVDEASGFMKAGMVTIEVLGRRAETSCLVGERGSTAVLGQVALHITRLRCDVETGELVPCADSIDRPHYRI